MSSAGQDHFAASAAQPDDRLDAFRRPRRALVVRGAGRAPRLAAVDVARRLEAAAVASVRIAANTESIEALEEPARMVARSCDLIIAVGDCLERALNFAADLGAPLLTLEAACPPDLTTQLDSARVDEVPVVATSADLAAPHWRAEQLIVTPTTHRSMRVRFGHAEPVKVSGPAKVCADILQRRLTVETDAGRAQCAEVAFRTTGAPLRASAGTHTFTARRVVARVELVRRVRLPAT